MSHRTKLIKLFHLLITIILDGKLILACFKLLIQNMELIVTRRNLVNLVKLSCWKPNQKLKLVVQKFLVKIHLNFNKFYIKHKAGQRIIKHQTTFQIVWFLNHTIFQILEDMILWDKLEIKGLVDPATLCHLFRS
jgi:hypothetical protein